MAGGTMTVQFADGTTETYQAEPFSGGAQGEIFLSTNGQHAVKLYFPDPKQDAERIQRIEMLIKQFNPTTDRYWEEYFTWPERLVKQPRVGFRMRFAAGLRTLDHFIFGKSFQRLPAEERGWLIGRLAVAIKLVSAANQLSSRGLCYPDFSHRNVLVDAFEGRMVLIDCDSLTVPGRLPAQIEGTSWYRAPEIIMHQVREPSVASDRHSLAILLYLWLLTWHPLFGDRSIAGNTEDAEEALLGREALYIEHPTDKRNRASGLKLTSHALGSELEKLFQTAFVDGLHAPDKRPRPFEWQRALAHTYDRLVPCAGPQCQWRFFVAEPRPRLTCPACGTPLGYPTTLPFLYLLPHKGTADPDLYNLDVTSAHYLAGWPGRAIQQWHALTKATPYYTDPAHKPDLIPLAIFDYDQHKQEWQLKNLGLNDARYQPAGAHGGAWVPWLIGETIALQQGMLLQLGPGPDYYRARIQIAGVN